MPDMRKALEEEIAKAVAVGQDDPNISEACTCDWIVRPLLEAAGYSKTEIVPQAIDGANQFPDYTILPQHQATWFLEAKSWKTKLTDSHAQQAINYANQNGKRWVVLTNGRQWRLYDNYIVGVAAAGKLVACIELEDVEAATAFLTALGRHSMTSGGAEDYAITAQLAAALDQELADPDSQVIKAICSKLKTRPGLGSLTREQIRAFFGNRKVPSPPAPAPDVVTPQPARPPGSRREQLLAEQDTIVVPARREGFLRVFLGENAWWAIRINKKRIPHIKWIAAYQVRPISAITHIAPVARIEPHGSDGKYKVIFAEPAREIGPLKPSEDMKTGFLQSPRMTTCNRILAAAHLDGVFPCGTF